MREDADLGLPRAGEIVSTSGAAGGIAPLAAGADAGLVDLWLHGRPATTRRAYGADAAAFLAFVAKPLRAVTLADVQAYADQLADRAPASRARTLSGVKSLLTFGHRLGVLPVNAGAPLRLPKLKNTLAARILEEADVQRLLALESHARNRALLHLAYGAGLRVSEVVGWCWRDVQPRGDAAGQVTVYGKGGKTRTVLLSPGTWRALLALGHGADERRAGLRDGVSPHWLRHAHASHALDRGAPIHLVQATLGHAAVATTGRYLHARPSDSSARYLAV